ncbi:MAG TPA: glycosyltransferase 87 family protein [Pedococcus sp.]|nr:glycosyltransferase 87 family protein [Pedococcus sp.]HEV7196168.1 glycosyltransferase 87 family protein [Pedococcus sp.]
MRTATKGHDLMVNSDGRVGTLPTPLAWRLRGGRQGFVLASFAGLVACALGVRWALGPFSSPDVRIYLAPWYLHLQQQGFSGFREAFADYNPPYLYLLYLASLFHLPALVAVKAVSALGDVSLAFAVAAVVRQVRGGRLVPWAAGLGTMFVPTVFLNSAAWGQTDAMYASILLWSLFYCLRDQHLLSWLIFGVAFAFKLQAVFLLPFLLLIWLLGGRQRWWTPVVALVGPIVALVPAWLAGRPLGSLLHIYSTQAGSLHFLAYGPSLPGWFPRQDEAIFARLFVVLTVAAMLAIFALVGARPAVLSDPSRRLSLAALVLMTVPFLLPHMRERYFFPGEILVLVLAFARPRSAWLAVVTLTVSMLCYLEILLGVALPVSLAVLSLAILVVLIGLARESGLGLPATIDLAHEGRRSHEPERSLR